jgi:hypothetical protein
MNIRTNKTHAALVACVFLSMPPVVSHAAEGATDFIRREIDNMNREGSSIDRTKHAQELSDLIKNDARDRIKDSDIDLLAGMMQDKDDSVRYWIATSLGFIGARTQRSAPALERALRDRACDHSSKTSASAIRLAFRRIGVASPNIGCNQ